MYKQCRDINGEVSNRVVQRLSDTAFIPFDPANTDYQAYLKWVSEGNTPLPVEASPEETNTPVADGVQ